MKQSDKGSGKARGRTGAPHRRSGAHGSGNPGRGGQFRPGGFNRRREAPAPGEHFLFGLHTVSEALANPHRTLHRLLATPNAIARLGDRVPHDLKIEEVNVGALGRITGPDAVHQGAVLYCDPLPEPSHDDLIRMRRLVALDQVSDPHNVGAILRSCAAFAVDALIMTSRHSPQETAVLAKSASGALDHVPLMRVQNMVRTLEALKESGMTLVGLDSEADETLEAVMPAGPVCLVLGAEGKGLRQSTRAACTHLARLDMPGTIASLNVSNAAALSLYVCDRRQTTDS